MTNENDKKATDEQDPVISGLARLREAIDRQSYPGRAWPAHGRRRRALRIVFGATGAAAAAAAIVAAVILAGGPERKPIDGPTAEKGISRPKVAATAPSRPAPSESETGLTFILPSEFDPAVAGGLTMEIPEVSMTAGDGFGDFEWSVPVISFPSLELRSNEDEKAKDDSDSVGPDSGRRPDGFILLGSARRKARPAPPATA